MPPLKLSLIRYEGVAASFPVLFGEIRGTAAIPWMDGPWLNTGASSLCGVGFTFSARKRVKQV